MSSPGYSSKAWSIQAKNVLGSDNGNEKAVASYWQCQECSVGFKNEHRIWRGKAGFLSINGRYL